MCQRLHNIKHIQRHLCLIVLCLVLLPPGVLAKVQSKPLTLHEEVEAIVAQYHVPPESVSIHALYLNSDGPLLEYNARKALIPASTMKILTTVAAFETFGAKHRYPTEFYTSTTEVSSVLPDLWIKGYGDPFFVNEELRLIAKTLHKRGIRKIEGPIYVDDSYFGPTNPIRYEGNSGKGLYRVVTGALSFNFNRPEVLISKALHYQRKAKRQGGISTASGRSPLLNRKILDPAIYTGMALKEFLSRQGITVTGDVLYKPVDPHAQLILHHGSRPMSEVLRGLNKESNNFIAEQILRSIAAARYGIASREIGLSVLSETLKSVGTGSIPYELDNASGLSRQNRLAAVHLTALLRHALRAPYGETFTRTLSIAGVDGTLRRRFKRSPLRGKLWAKTGSLYQVSALAGYTMAGQEPIAFAILINDYTVSPDRIQRAQEKILEAVSRRVTHGDEI